MLRAGAKFQAFCCFLARFVFLPGRLLAPFCDKMASLAQQPSITSAAYTRTGHHVTDVRCAVDES